MPRIYPISKQQFLVTIKDIETYWETFSGIDESTQVSEYSDGYDNRLYPMLGPRSMAELTFTKAFDPDQDAPIIDFWRNFRLARGQDVNSRGYTVTVQPVEYSPEPVSIGSPITVYGFIPIRLQGFEVDKKSQDVSMLTLVGRALNWKYK